MFTRLLLAVVTVPVLSLLSACGSSGHGRACDGGMCTTEGAAITESQFRERASTFAQQRLVEQQRSSSPITAADGRPLPAGRIDPQSWDVSMANKQWRGERYLTRDLWQVVECNADGSAASSSIVIGPAPTRKS